MNECKCDMRTKLVGDGCSVCNPERYEPNDLVSRLNEPEVHYPHNFDTPKRANAILSSLCQEAADEIERLQDELASCTADLSREVSIGNDYLMQVNALKKDLAALKSQEPVAEVVSDHQAGLYDELPIGTRLYTSPTPTDRDAERNLLEVARGVTTRYQARGFYIPEDAKDLIEAIKAMQEGK